MTGNIKRWRVCLLVSNTLRSSQLNRIWLMLRDIGSSSVRMTTRIYGIRTPVAEHANASHKRKWKPRYMLPLLCIRTWIVIVEIGFKYQMGNGNGCVLRPAFITASIWRDHPFILRTEVEWVPPLKFACVYIWTSWSCDQKMSDVITCQPCCLCINSSLSTRENSLINRHYPSSSECSWDGFHCQNGQSADDSICLRAVSSTSSYNYFVNLHFLLDS